MKTTTPPLAAPVPLLVLAGTFLLAACWPRPACAAAAPDVDRVQVAAPVDSLPPILLERIDGLPVTAGVTDEPGPRPFSLAGEKRAEMTIRVRGRLVCRRPDGVLEGVDKARYFVLDDDPVPDLCTNDWLAFAETDQDGNFDVTFTWPARDPWCDQDPDLYLDFSSFGLRTATVMDFRGTFIDYGTLVTADPLRNERLHANDVTQRMVRWFASRGYAMPSGNATMVTIGGSANSALNAHWSPPLKNVREEDAWNDLIIARLTAEEWMLQHGALWDVDLCDGTCDGSGLYCGYCTWCPESPAAAGQKGLAEFMAEQALADNTLGYAWPAWFVPDYEHLGDCGLVPVAPWETAGVFAACLHDMSDTVDEDDPVFPAGRDAMGWGPDFVLQIVAEDKPSTPGEFFADFRARYPGACEQIWLTAANVGYDLDGLPPGPITGLSSSSHTPGVASTNDRVALSWTNPADDCFATKRYAYRVAASPTAPGTTADLEGVSSFTTPPVAPGTWYITLRVGDLSDNWRSDYATFGPVVIAPATPANLTNVSRTGWAAPVVPRAAADATTGNVPAPATLTGNATATWWNVSLQNTGGSPAASSGAWVMADGAGFWNPINPVPHAVAVPALAGLQAWQAVNIGPIPMRGGRHTFGAWCDFTGLVAESSETDNDTGRQWTWTPYQLAAGGNTHRLAPPPRSGGWDHATGTLYYNCDGVRFTASGWWNALALDASDDGADYDARLHVAATGASDGFGANAGWSSRPAGMLDAVFVNRNQTGASVPWDVGIIQTRDLASTGGYDARHVMSVEQAFGNSVEVTLGAFEGMAIREVYLPAGWSSAIVRLVAGQGPLRLSWLAADFVTGGLDDADGAAEPDADDVTRLEVSATAPGYHAFAIYRDPAPSAFDEPVTFTFQVIATPPDFQPNTPAGWAGAVVPRAAHDGLPGNVPAPTVLLGWTDATWLNLSTANTSPVAALLATTNRVLVDDEVVYTQTVPSYAAGGVASLQPAVPVYVRGGRHTLSLRTDAPHERAEISETNNDWAVQYAWSPASLSLGTTPGLPQPGDPAAGWDALPTGPYWPDSDGYRTPLFTPTGGVGNWIAAATLPTGTGDVDLRLHEADNDPATAFTTTLGVSSLGSGAVDFVAVDLGATNSRFFDVGVTGAGGTGGFAADIVASTFLDTDPAGAYGPFTLASGRAIALHEVELTDGFLRIHLVNGTPTEDLDVTVFPPEGIAFGPTDAPEGGRGADGGSGQDEWVVVPVTVGGSWCVAVTRSGTANLADPAAYTLDFQAVSAVGDPTPTVRTALVGAHPNPFNPQTTVAFDLAAPGEVSLDIYDTAGRRVRRLADGSFGAGRHEVVWNGRDDGGRTAASGVYVVRFVQGDVREHAKISLMK